jgi:hypothetical protein
VAGPTFRRFSSELDTTSAFPVAPAKPENRESNFDESR